MVNGLTKSKKHKFPSQKNVKLSTNTRADLAEIEEREGKQFVAESIRKMIERWAKRQQKKL